MTKKEILREKIINKFNSIAVFCRLTGLPRNRVAIALQPDDKGLLKEIEEAYKKTEISEHYGVIREDHVEEIRLCINKSFKKVRHFCLKHPEYNQVYVSNILNGNLTRETKKYRDLVQLLTKEYDLKNTVWLNIKRARNWM
jgi:hypothetical protein